MPVAKSNSVVVGQFRVVFNSFIRTKMHPDEQGGTGGGGLTVRDTGQHCNSNKLNLSEIVFAFQDRFKSGQFSLIQFMQNHQPPHSPSSGGSTATPLSNAWLINQEYGNLVDNEWADNWTIRMNESG